MTQIETLLSNLEKGARINFNYHLRPYGFGPIGVSATFVSCDPTEHTLTYRTLYSNSVGEGPKETVSYQNISNLREIVCGNSGPK